VTTRTARLTIAALLFALAAASTQSAQAADLSGSWKGTWESCVTGHKGPLRANFCRLDDCHYEVTFLGRFFKVMPFRYKMTMRIVSESPGSVTLRGSKDLGRLAGGVYTFAAASDGCRFTANYCSSKDRGTFRLSRN